MIQLRNSSFQMICQSYVRASTKFQFNMDKSHRKFSNISLSQVTQFTSLLWHCLHTVKKKHIITKGEIIHNPQKLNKINQNGRLKNREVKSPALQTRKQNLQGNSQNCIMVKNTKRYSQIWVPLICLCSLSESI